MNALCLYLVYIIISMGRCRLCLVEDDKKIEIFGKEGREQNVHSILSEFIWFQIIEDDAISTAVCRKCWLSLSTFHIYISSIKLAQLQLQHNEYFLASSDYDNKRHVFPDSAAAASVGNIPTDKCNGPIIPNLELKTEEKDIETDASDNQQTLSLENLNVVTTVSSILVTQQRKSEQHLQSNMPERDKIKLIHPVINAAHSDNETHDEDDEEDDPDDDEMAANEDDDDDDEEEDDDDYDDGDYNDVPPKQHSSTANKTNTNRKQRKNSSSEDDALIRSMCALKCSNCSNDVPPFETFGELEKHYRIEHDAVGFVMCCGRKLTKRHRLLDHIQSHLNPDAFKCTVCKARFSGSFPLKRHMVTHVPDEKRRFACTECPKRYTNAVQLSRHCVNKHSGDMEKRFGCAVCQRMYLTEEKLTAHVKRSHNVDMVPHICDYCGKEFRSISNLNKHRKDVHSGQERARKQCSVCGTWLSEFYLRRHMRQHNNSKVETCTVCGKTLQNKNTLANHMRYVHGSRRHQCTLCDKSFTKPMSLREHMAVHTGKDLYTCSYCPKTFKSDSNMYSHQKKSHTEEWTRDRGKRLAANNAPPLMPT